MGTASFHPGKTFEDRLFLSHSVLRSIAVGNGYRKTVPPDTEDGPQGVKGIIGFQPKGKPAMTPVGITGPLVSGLHAMDVLQAMVLHLGLRLIRFHVIDVNAVTVRS